MKRKLLAVLLLVGQLLILVSFKQTEDPVVRVGTWNVHGSEAEPAEQNALIAEYDLDALAVQEVEGQSQLDALQNDIFSFGKFFSTISEEDYGLGYLSQRALYETEAIELPNDAYHTLESRYLVVSKIFVDGKIVYLYNTHLSFENDEIRAAQIEAIAEEVSQHEGEYQIILGDFNLKDLAELEALEGFTSVSTAEDPIETYHGDDWDTKALDHILYSENLELADSYAVPNDLSDHDMLIAEFYFAD
ncbi:MAG: endonuclease/exonuclease/phosphatase family protein [Candidatus Merdivicinus sp.]|jgi:hexosaminidase